MGRIWTDDRKFEIWKQVEIHALEAWAQLGKVPQDAVAATRNAPAPTAAQIAEREAVTDHDVAAFVDVLGATAGEVAAPWIHYGLTSSDVVDTSTGVMLKEAGELIQSALSQLFDTVKQLALAHRRTYMVGRTHGIWAEPTTFGLKLAGWAFELARDNERLKQAVDGVAVGKLSGAVGSYAHLPPSIEEHVCQSLGLEIEPASTQVTARDRHASYLQTLALIGASIERMATEIRHLQRSEVGEVREHFKKGQKGSSAMPHKRNPILSERMTGMARLLRGYAQVGLENVALWHERDISHSSAERVVLPDASILAHYMLVKFNSLVGSLDVNTNVMQQNIKRTRGLVFSQALLLALIETGLARDEAYRIVQRNAMAAWEGGDDLETRILADPDATVDPAVIEECFSLERLDETTKTVFDRLQLLNVGD